MQIRESTNPRRSSPERRDRPVVEKAEEEPGGPATGPARSSPAAPDGYHSSPPPP